jgi:hypothetical protein
MDEWDEPVSPKRRKHTWKPGQTGNPKGRGRLPPEIKQLKILSTMELMAGMNEIIRLNVSELKERMNDPNITSLEAGICKILFLAITKGDHIRMDFILNRLIGKSKETIEIQQTAIAERIKEISAMSEEERLKLAAIEIEKLKRR